MKLKESDLITKYETEATVADIAQGTGLSESTVRRAIRNLQEKGLVRYSKTPHGNKAELLDPTSGKQLYAVWRGEDIAGFVTLPEPFERKCREAGSLFD
jgi:transposase